MVKFEHFSPYLPYQLQVKVNAVFMSNFDTKPLMRGASATLTPSLLADIYERTFDSLGRFKPILKPLSDLTSEMPNSKCTYADFLWHNIIATDNDVFDKDEFIEMIELEQIGFLPFKVVEQLLRWHFDIYNLIDKGLALDINKITQDKIDTRECITCDNLVRETHKCNTCNGFSNYKK